MLQAGGLHRIWRGFVTLVMAFGLWGLVVWPVTGWLGYRLLHKEISGIHGLHVNTKAFIGRDFVNIWHGGQEGASRGATGVYDRQAYLKTLYAKARFAGLYTFSYPPHMLMLALPFGLMDYLTALLAWTVITFAMFWYAARPWLADVGLPAWSVLILPATIVNLWAGHFGYFIGALALYGWRRAATNPQHGGLAFAVMTVKPHMGLLVPLVLAVTRQWRTMLWAGVGAGLLVAASTLIFGVWAWTTWLSATLAFQADLIEVVPRQPYSYMMPTSGRMLYALSSDTGLVLIGQILIGLYAVAAILWANRRGVPVRDLGLLSIVAIPLILPYSFNYDMVALCVVALACAVRFKARWWSLDKPVYAAAFLIPLTQTPLAKLGWWPSPIALMLLLGVAAWRMTREIDAAPTRPAMP